MWPKINKDLLPMKGHYFLFNAGTAPVQPFMPVYAKQLGFSSVVVGTVYSILPVTGMLAKPFFGALADRFRMQKLLFLCFQIVTIIAFFSIQFVPDVPYKVTSEVTMVCGPETYFHGCTNNTLQQCTLAQVLEESKDDRNIKCELKCELTPDLRQQLCGPWNLSRDICIDSGEPITTRNTITEDDISAGKGSKSSGKDLHSPKFISAGSKSKLEFIADVPLIHTTEININCLAFRIANASFADGSTHVPYCNKVVDTTCEIHCEDSTVTQLITQKDTSEHTDVTSLYQFWLFFCLLALSWVGMAVVVSVADAICFEMLGERASEYGHQRLWGSIGWGIFAVISGLIVDEFSKGELTKNYTPVFYLMLILLSSDVVCSYNLRYEQTKMSTNILKDIGKLLANFRIVVFMLWCVFIGMCTGIQWNFLFWYLEELATNQGCDTVAWIKTLQGLVSGVQCFLGELPSFFLSGWILKKIGHIHSMTLVLFVVGVRFLLYSVLENPWWCLPIELFQATFGLFYSTMASYASIVAPPGTEATIQGLVGAIFEGVGVALGSLLGGIFFQNYGGANCFRIFGVTAMIMFVLHGSVQYFLSRRTPNFRFDGKGNTRQDDASHNPGNRRNRRRRRDKRFFNGDGLLNFNGVARYATPNEAVSMLEDT